MALDVAEMDASVIAETNTWPILEMDALANTDLRQPVVKIGNGNTKRKYETGKGGGCYPTWCVYTRAMMIGGGR